MNKKKVKFYKTLNYDFGNDNISVPFQYVVEKDGQYYYILAKSIVSFYNLENKEEATKIIEKLLDDEMIDDEHAFNYCCEQDMLDYYEDDARDAFGGFYDCL